MAAIYLQGIRIHVLNVWQTFEWYRLVFEAELVSAAPDGSRLELKIGNESVVFVADSAERANFWNAQINSFLSDPAGFHLVFVATEVQVVFDRAVAHGAVVLLKPTLKSNGLIEATLRDLNGIAFKISSFASR